MYASVYVRPLKSHATLCQQFVLSLLITPCSANLVAKPIIADMPVAVVFPVPKWMFQMLVSKCKEASVSVLMFDRPHVLTWEKSQAFEMKSHSLTSEAADLEGSLYAACMYVYCWYTHYIVFSHTTTFKDSASSYLTITSCPCGFVVDPVLINHVMFHIDWHNVYWM